MLRAADIIDQSSGRTLSCAQYIQGLTEAKKKRTTHTIGQSSGRTRVNFTRAFYGNTRATSSSGLLIPPVNKISIQASRKDLLKPFLHYPVGSEATECVIPLSRAFYSPTCALRMKRSSTGRFCRWYLRPNTFGMRTFQAASSFREIWSVPGDLRLSETTTAITLLSYSSFNTGSATV